MDVADEMADADVSYLGSATLTNNHDALTIDASAAKAISRLATERQRQLATDFAVNRQFRRDVFARSASPRSNEAIAEVLGNVVIGCTTEPADIGTTVQVPRGRITFHENFVAALRALMCRGSMTLLKLTKALGGGSEIDAQVRRNLLYLVAAGVLTPFATSYRAPAPRTDLRFADKSVERMFLHVAKGHGPRHIASRVVGSGIALTVAEAAAVIDAVAGRPHTDARDVPSGLIPRLLRLGLLR